VSDPFNLQRFVDAQDPVFDEVRAELRAGRKRSHWMWFVFPQIQGLGRSSMATKYAISSRAEATAYLQHTILGPRLRECVQLVLSIPDASAREIFDSPDDVKFRSSLTLFAHATTDNQLFLEALEKYFDGQFDPLTVQQLAMTR
jgi:uncharacterized protein (DUF1810 family)